jgi:hypothetical protein
LLRLGVNGANVETPQEYYPLILAVNDSLADVRLIYESDERLRVPLAVFNALRPVARARRELSPTFRLSSACR